MSMICRQEESVDRWLCSRTTTRNSPIGGCPQIGNQVDINNMINTSNTTVTAITINIKNNNANHKIMLN